MITQKDINLLKTIFLTRNEFEEIIEQIIDKKLDEKLDEKLRFLPTKEEFFTRMDQLSAEIRDLREEVILISGRTEEHGERVDEHDKEIQALKKHTNF